MADLADLVIRFSSQGAKKVIGEIDNVNSSGSSATSSLKKVAGAAARHRCYCGYRLRRHAD